MPSLWFRTRDERPEKKGGVSRTRTPFIAVLLPWWRAGNYPSDPGQPDPVLSTRECVLEPGGGAAFRSDSNSSPLTLPGSGEQAGPLRVSLRAQHVLAGDPPQAEHRLRLVPSPTFRHEPRGANWPTRAKQGEPNAAFSAASGSRVLQYIIDIYSNTLL